MDIVRDEREEMINKLCLYVQSVSDQEVGCIKSSLYILLNEYEIANRSTELAEVQTDRNEYLLKSFLIAKKVKGCTEQTLRYYRTEVKKILEKIGKNAEEVTTDDIRYYMAVRQNRDKVSKVTIGSEIRAFGSFYNWLYAEELIRKNPMTRIDRIKIEKTKKEALTEMEIERLRLHARGEKEKLIIEVLLSTGCRVSELVNILLTDIDGEKVLVHGKGEKDRYVYLNAKAVLALESYMNQRKDRNPYLIPRMKSVRELSHKSGRKDRYQNLWKYPENICDGGHADKSTVEQITRRIAKRAGVEKANPHKFRRTCATMALRRGMPIEQVSKMLGHESIETTQIYLDLSEDELEQAHKKYVV